MKKLNLGSGEFQKEGFINVDYYSVSKPDISHDLNQFPYPFEDNEIDYLESFHCLEHLENPFRVMKEIHRICKNGAKIWIKVPHFSRGFTHAEHNSGFDFSFPYYFKNDFKGGYQGFEFELEKLRMTWFAQRSFKKTVLSKPIFYIAYFIGSIFTFFANLSPVVCSRFWCFWVGGFEEIEFHLIVKK